MPWAGSSGEHDPVLYRKYGRMTVVGSGFPAEAFFGRIYPAHRPMDTYWRSTLKMGGSKFRVRLTSRKMSGPAKGEPFTAIHGV
jgi:hypothetical protein